MTDAGGGPSVQPVGSKALYAMVEGGRYGAPTGRAFDIFVALVVVFSVGMAVIGTDARLTRHLDVFRVFEAGCAFVFAFEYFLRLAVCNEDRQGRYPHWFWGRLRYAMTPMAIVDLIAFLPWVIGEFTTIDSDKLLVMRCIALFKLLRYSQAFETISHVVRNERRLLGAAFLLMAILLVMISAMAYVVERRLQPEGFGSVLRAMWWGIGTLTNTGYGDVVPDTTAGKLLAVFAMIVSLGMIALPVAIIANGFAEETRRRNFVVTWQLVANVPIFSHLPASRIAEISAMLESHVASRGEAILVKGERGDGMYFLVDGEVEVMLEPEPVRLYPGDYFGEIALLFDRPRSATVVARRFSQLLKLRVDNFRRLMEQDKELAESIRQVATRRLAAGAGRRVGSRSDRKVEID